MALTSLFSRPKDFFFAYIYWNTETVLKAKLIWAFFFFLSKTSWLKPQKLLAPRLIEFTYPSNWHSHRALTARYSKAIVSRTLRSDFGLLELSSNLQDYISRSWRLQSMTFSIRKTKIFLSKKRLQTLLLHRTRARGGINLGLVLCTKRVCNLFFLKLL